MEYHSAIKSNEILIHATMDKPWKQYASDRNQSQKKPHIKYFRVSALSRIGKSLERFVASLA